MDRYIRIESIADIDLSKITLGAINNRYVDREGKRYATRFNMRTRKVEIVRIAVGKDEALLAKKSRRETEGGAAAQVPDGRLPKPDWLSTFGIGSSASFDFHGYYSNIEAECSKISERMRGIISNVKNSDAFESAETETGKDFILEITTFFDREVQENLSHTQNLIVEFHRFPKPPSNYFIHLSRKQKLMVETMEEDQQMNYFKALMVGTAYMKALHGALNLLNKCKTQFKLINPNAIPYEKKSFFDNALEASGYVETSLINETSQTLTWMEQQQVF